MIGERDNKYTDIDYGALHMQPYTIDGNEINAFYDSDDNLVFVLDNTINSKKPNVLLVINPDGDRKWDEILSDDYDVDLETIRPKQDNKYQKLDIEYSGLNVYEQLINAYKNGDSLDNELNQLNVLRDSASRHSAMVRLNAANDVISKTNATIVKTKESIVRLQERIKTLRAKLTATKKEIGRVPTKQSASRVLKLESQIEALNEKLKRAKKRLDSAQKRLEIATVDSELASELLNQPSTEIKPVSKTTTNHKSVAVASKNEVKKIEPDVDDENKDFIEDKDEYTETDDEVFDVDNTVKPLFEEDPKILNDNIAFKPVSFDTPSVPEIENMQKQDKESDVAEITEQEVPELPKPENHEEEIPYLNNMLAIPEIAQSDVVKEEEKPVLESLAPISNVPEFSKDIMPDTESRDNDYTDIPKEQPVLESLAPINNIPEIPEDFEPVINDEKPVTETPENETEMRQPEPEVIEEKETLIETNPVVDNNLVAPMTESLHEEIVGENKKQKTTLTYYVLLIVLIALSVFTLWLYQKNVDNSAPMLTADVEKTTVLKKTEKPKRVEKADIKKEVKTDVEPEPVFLDEEPVAEPVVVSDEPQEIINEPSEPIVMDTVPARVGRSVDIEDDEHKIATEEEVLASKPIYEPGTRQDKAVITENIEYADNVEDTDNNEGYYEADDSEELLYSPEDDLFYDAEEAEYQAEQQELNYEE